MGTNNLNRMGAVNGLKVSFLIKQADVHRLIPWDIPAEDVQVFDPVQEWLTCVIAGLRTDERDLRNAEFINLLVSVNDQPVFWSATEHLFARVKVDPGKRAQREEHLRSILEKTGVVYDAKQSGKNVPSPIQASNRKH